MTDTKICKTPDETFELGESIAGSLGRGDVVMLFGGLGAGKTLLTKGILHGLGYDVDEVTSPSFTLVNLYETDKFDVYHIDLWRLDAAIDVAAAVGLEEILEDEDSVVVIEWAEKLGAFRFSGNVIRIAIDGDGDERRTVSVERSNGR